MTEPLCGRVRELLPALDDLPADERQEAQSHLRGCASCAEEARALRETLGALRGLPRVAPPPDLAARIERAIDSAGRQRPRGRSRVRRHAVAMILVVGLLAGIIRMIPHGPGVPNARKGPLPPASAPATEGAASPPAETATAASSAENRAAPAPSPSARKEVAEGEIGLRKDLDEGKVRRGRAQGLGATVGAAQTNGVPAPADASSIDLLRHPRAEQAWVDAVRRLVTERPEDLLRGWKSLTPREQSEVLAHWSRAATAPGVAADLDAAMARTKDTDLRHVLHALREFTP
jgi:hypothetical protein